MKGFLKFSGTLFFIESRLMVSSTFMHNSAKKVLSVRFVIFVNNPNFALKREVPVHAEPEAVSRIAIQERIQSVVHAKF